MIWRELLPTRGVDEWHNRSWFINWPGIGMKVWYPRKPNREGPEHLHGNGPEGTVGYIDPTCKTCSAILADFVG